MPKGGPRNPRPIHLLVRVEEGGQEPPKLTVLSATKDIEVAYKAFVTHRSDPTVVELILDGTF